MRGIFVFLLAISIILILWSPVYSAPKDSKITIFVAKFEDATGEAGRAYWTDGGIPDPGEAFRQYLKQRLLAVGQFRVFDVEKTFEETQNLNEIAAQTNPGAAYDQGNLQFHNYVIEGTITTINVVDKGGALGDWTGGAGMTNRITSCVVIVNMRDQESGETVFSEEVYGDKKRENFVLVTDQGAGGTSNSGERSGDVGYALQTASDNILALVLEKFPIEGTILKITGKDAYVDLGAAQGIKEGDLLKLIEYAEVDLGFEVIYEAKEIGDVKVTQVIDDTHCKIALKKGNWAEGMTVRVIFKAK
jgi:curli biogenesis system outer membrane secretion channel CsgG